MNFKNTLFNKAFGGFSFVKDEYARHCVILVRDYKNQCQKITRDYTTQVNKLKTDWAQQELDATDPLSLEWGAGIQKRFKELGIKPTYPNNKIGLKVKELKKNYPLKKKFNIISLIKRVFRWI